MLALPVLLIRGWKPGRQEALGAACSATLDLLGFWAGTEVATRFHSAQKHQYPRVKGAVPRHGLCQIPFLFVPELFPEGPWHPPRGASIVGHPAWHLVMGCRRQNFCRSLGFDDDLQRKHCWVFVLVMNFQSYHGLRWGYGLLVSDPSEPLGFHTEM